MIARLVFLAALGCVACQDGPKPKPPVDPGTGSRPVRPPVEHRPPENPDGERPGMKSIDTRWRPLVIGDRKARVRLAVTELERGFGLSNVRSLEPDQGMLFVYRHARPRTFWMKDCLIPLDIAFLRKDGEIFQLTTLKPAKPGTPDVAIPSVRSREPIVLVLEMPGGYFEKHRMGVGTRVVIPKSYFEKAE